MMRVCNLLGERVVYRRWTFASDASVEDGVTVAKSLEHHTSLSFSD